MHKSALTLRWFSFGPGTRGRQTNESLIMVRLFAALIMLIISVGFVPAAEAAVTATNLYSGGSNAASQSSFVTSSTSPGANKLILLAVGYYTDGAGATISSVTGNGLTWVVVASTSFVSGFYRTYLFRAMGSSPSSGAATINFSVADIYNVAVGINEFSNVDTSGTNGSGAIVQSATNTSDSATSLTVTLGAFGSTDNATFGAFGHPNASPTAGTGFTQLSEYHSVGWNRNIGTQTEWRSDNDTTVDISVGSSAVMGIAVEIKFAAAAVADTSGAFFEFF